MTRHLKTFRLNVVKWTVFILIFGLISGFQQRPFVELFGQNQSAEAHNHHEDMETSFVETVEILLTGSLTHTHEHDESQGEGHEHSHEHHFSGTVASSVFILAQIHFAFSSIIQVWPSFEGHLVLDPYFAEILKPPIFT